ncbi:MAG TPA: ABC transporter ATP-binding protein [Deltaproteobacteria bacterium]|nr:ABC transporter ATP-binding protein [Deltaproteobacteria bacterium]HQI81022.1 ABC transporter ATP-binding protein [Deltaproteobacteria bacterium]
MSHHIVELKGLSHVYPDGTEALSDISIRITHGESVAVVGANGAGKSTLLLHLNGFLKPSSGSVRIGDYPLTKETLQEVRRTVGMIFQDPDDQLFMSTIQEDVAFGPFNLGLPRDEVDQRVADALERMGINHLRDKPPFRLSAGEKRRAAIATVLSMTPDIMVLDEPTTGLDPLGRRQIITILREFTHTKIIATHDLDLVLDLCARTIVLHQGRIWADGQTCDIFRDEALLHECHLEKPLSMQGCPVCSAGTPED